MKYKHAFAVGNLLMAIGMVLMLGSLGYNLLSHIFPLGLPDILSDASLMGIFIGALVWLAGARIGGVLVVEKPLQKDIGGCVIMTNVIVAMIIIVIHNSVGINKI